MGKPAAAPIVFYHHTTLERANQVLLYGFPSGPDGVGVLLSKDASAPDGAVVLRVAIPSDIGPRIWSMARLRSDTGMMDFMIPGSMLRNASLNVVDDPSPAPGNA